MNYYRHLALILSFITITIFAASKGKGKTSATPGAQSPSDKAPSDKLTPPHASESVDSNCWVLDNFSQDPSDSFPSQWQPKYPKNLEETKTKKLWWVEDNEGRRALHGTYSEHTITLVRKIENLDLAKYPFFEYEWKAMQLPEGGDENKLSKNDSAASVYVVWKERWPMEGSFIRLAWSSTEPVDSLFSRRVGYEKIMIKESGTQYLGKWRKERVNMLELSKTLLKKEDNVAPIALALNTHADATHSKAEAYYANFKFCSK